MTQKAINTIVARQYKLQRPAPTESHKFENQTEQSIILAFTSFTRFEVGKAKIGLYALFLTQV